MINLHSPPTHERSNYAARTTPAHLQTEAPRILRRWPGIFQKLGGVLTRKVGSNFVKLRLNQGIV